MRTCILITTVALLSWGTTVSALAHRDVHKAAEIAEGIVPKGSGSNSREIHNNDYAGGQPNSGTDVPGDSGSPSGGVSGRGQPVQLRAPIEPPKPGEDCADSDGSSSSSSSEPPAMSPTSSSESAKPTTLAPVGSVQKEVLKEKESGSK